MRNQMRKMMTNGSSGSLSRNASRRTRRGFDGCPCRRARRGSDG
jgi:hypothetical protein